MDKMARGGEGKMGYERHDVVLKAQSDSSGLAVISGSKRVGDHSRGEAIKTLNNALAVGVLPPDVHEARVRHVLDAEDDRAIENVMRDLPVAKRTIPPLWQAVAVVALAVLASLLVMIAVPFGIYQLTAIHVLENPGPNSWMASFHSGMATMAWVGAMLTGLVSLAVTVLLSIAYFADLELKERP